MAGGSIRWIGQRMPDIVLRAALRTTYVSPPPCPPLVFPPLTVRVADASGEIC